ncbi:hypothetical protein ADUPG1_004646, partial [Aduncisulcus paluster]
MKSGTSYRLLLSANTSEKQGLLQFTNLLPKEDAPEEEEEEPEVVAPSFSALNDEGRRIVKDLLDTYWKEVSPEEFARVEPIEFTLKDPDKVFKAAHRHHTLKNTKIINDQIEEWLKDGKIRPSTSEFSSALTVAPKKDSAGRVCVDARTFNKHIVGNEYPLPR